MQQLHAPLRHAAATGRGPVDAVDEPHHIGCDRAGTDQDHHKTKRRHIRVLLDVKLMFYTHYKSNTRSCQVKSNKISTFSRNPVDRRAFLY